MDHNTDVTRVSSDEKIIGDFVEGCLGAVEEQKGRENG